MQPNEIGLLPSEYIEQGGWCRGRLTLPSSGIADYNIGMSRWGGSTPDGHEFCIAGAISAAYQDEYLTLEQAIQYRDELERRIKGKLLLVILRPFCAFFDVALKSVPMIKKDETIESTAIAIYNDYICMSREKAVELMREVEHELGLVPAMVIFDGGESNKPNTSGVQTNISQEREILTVTVDDHEYEPARPKQEMI